MSVIYRPKNYYSGLRLAGKLRGTIKAAEAKRSARNKRALRGADPLDPTRRRSVNDYAERKTLRTIALGPVLTAEVAQEAREMRPRVSRWADPEPDTLSKRVYVAEEDRGKYSSRCTWHKIDHVPVYRSCGACTARHLVAGIGRDRYRYVAPRGWQFGADAYGLFIVRVRDASSDDIPDSQYHFTADDIRSGVSAIRAAALEHEAAQKRIRRERREREKAEAAAKAEAARNIRWAERIGIYVCAEDSRRAGNCLAGTAAWCRAQGVDVRSHVPLAIVERLARTDSRVSRVIDTAKRRAAEELAQGYCSLTRHGVR